MRAHAHHDAHGTQRAAGYALGTPQAAPSAPIAETSWLRTAIDSATVESKIRRRSGGAVMNVRSMRSSRRTLSESAIASTSR